MSAPIISPKFFSLGILLLLTTSILEAQENDDMYYSRKDRLKAVEQQQATPKDSPTYWTPNVAPYNYDDQGTTQVDTALMNKYAAQARQDNQEKIVTGNTYITNNYNNQNYNQQYSNQTSSRRRRRWGNNWNNNYNYGAGWNVSPYIGFGYNNYCGWGPSIGFGFGSGYGFNAGYGYGSSLWNNGWGGNFCYNYPYYTPFYNPYAYNSWYSPYYGGFYPYGNQVIIINKNANNNTNNTNSATAPASVNGPRGTAGSPYSNTTGSHPSSNTGPQRNDNAQGGSTPSQDNNGRGSRGAGTASPTPNQYQNEVRTYDYYSQQNRAATNGNSSVPTMTEQHSAPQFDNHGRGSRGEGSPSTAPSYNQQNNANQPTQRNDNWSNGRTNDNSGGSFGGGSNSGGGGSFGGGSGGGFNGGGGGGNNGRGSRGR